MGGRGSSSKMSGSGTIKAILEQNFNIERR